MKLNEILTPQGLSELTTENTIEIVRVKTIEIIDGIEYITDNNILIEEQIEKLFKINVYIILYINKNEYRYTKGYIDKKEYRTDNYIVELIKIDVQKIIDDLGQIYA